MSIKEDLNKLSFADKTNNQLPVEKQVESIKPAVGTSGFPVATATQPTSSGIDSPLSEQSRTEVDFEVFDDFNVWSVIEKHVTQLTMKDASNRVVVFKFIDPNTGVLVP